MDCFLIASQEAKSLPFSTFATYVPLIMVAIKKNKKKANAKSLDNTCSVNLKDSDNEHCQCNY